MAIHPHHADAILAGHKKVEFRKRPLAAEVSTVVIYATSPIKAIVGEFSVGGSLTGVPPDVWASVGSSGAIDKNRFDAYYASAPAAIAIRVRAAKRYSTPVPLQAIAPSPAVPQSFSYLDEEVLTQVRRLGNQTLPLLPKFGTALARLLGLGPGTERSPSTGTAAISRHPDDRGRLPVGG